SPLLSIPVVPRTLLGCDRTMLPATHRSGTNGFSRVLFQPMCRPRVGRYQLRFSLTPWHHAKYTATLAHLISIFPLPARTASNAGGAGPGAITQSSFSLRIR